MALRERALNIVNVAWRWMKIIGGAFILLIIAVAIFMPQPTEEEIRAREAEKAAAVAAEAAAAAAAEETRKKAKQIAREATIKAEFDANKNQILSHAKELLQSGDPAQVSALYGKYVIVDSNELHGYLTKAEEKSIVSVLEKDGSTVDGGNQPIRGREKRIEQVDKYKMLTELDPGNKDYASAYTAVLEEVETQKHQIAVIEKVKPYFSAWDGSHRKLERLIIDNLNDPDSYEHVSTNILFIYEHDLTVKTVYRARNGFGGMVRGSIIAKVSIADGSVLEIIHQE